MRTSFAVLAALLIPLSAAAEKLPSWAYRLTVTDSTFAGGAIPDDGLPDDAAFKAAIETYPNADTTIYVPCGRYDFVDSVLWKTADTDPTPEVNTSRWTARVTLEGERENCAELKLADNAVGFNDPNTPKAFLMSGTLTNNSSGTANTGNQGYQQNLIDLTINCGSGNPGVRCLDWLAHNQTSLRNVTIKSGDGQGLAGLYLGRAWPGPALGWNLRIEGFNYGIQFGQNQYSWTFLDLEVIGQLVAGVAPNQNMFIAENFVSDQTSTDVPAIAGATGQGHIDLVNATLTADSGASARSAIEIGSVTKYYVRNVTTTGYQSVLKRNLTVVAGTSAAEATNTAPYKLYNAPDGSLNLPVVYPPAPYWVDPDATPGAWVNVLDYGAGNGVGGETVDDTAGIQAAFNACLSDPAKAIVVFPKRTNTTPPGNNGTYVVKSKVVIPPCVRRIYFQGNALNIQAADFPGANDCVFSVETGTAEDEPLWIEYWRRVGGTTSLGGVPYGPAHYFCHTSARRVVATRLTSSQWKGDGPGTAWLLDTIGAQHFYGGYTAYVWQHNSEGTDPIGKQIVDGEGTNVRTIGFKTEHDFQHGEVTNDAKWEMLGGFLMPCVGIGSGSVQSLGFEVVDAQMSLSFLQHCAPSIGPHKLFPIAVRQQIGASVRTLLTSQTESSGGTGSNHWHVPLFNGWPDRNVVVAPEQLSSGSQVVTLPYGQGSASYKMVYIDPSEAEPGSVNMDPGMWTMPANCSGLSHLAAQVQKQGEGTLDVDIWSCQQFSESPPVGSIDPSTPPTPGTPTACRNLTVGATLDGVDPTDEFEYEGALGQLEVRLVDCVGDCKALVTLQCAR